MYYSEYIFSNQLAFSVARRIIIRLRQDIIECVSPLAGLKRRGLGLDPSAAEENGGAATHRLRH